MDKIHILQIEFLGLQKLSGKKAVWRLVAEGFDKMIFWRCKNIGGVWYRVETLIK